MGSWSQRPPHPHPASSPEVRGPVSLLLRDCVGTHARVRSSSRVRAPLAPAPRESWGTVRSKHCHSHEPHRETPLWGEGNRPKRLGARPMAGGDSSLRQRSKLPRHDPPPHSCPRDPGPPSVPAGLLEGGWVPKSELGADGGSAPLRGRKPPKWQPLGQAETPPAHSESVWESLSPGAAAGRSGLAVAAPRPSEC